MLLLWPSAARAADLVVAYSSFPPFKLIVQGQPMGIDAEIVALVARRMNLTPIFRKGSLEECLTMVRRGTADLMTSLSRTPDREAFLVFVEPAYHEESDKAVYQKKGAQKKIARYEDLSGLTVGVKLGAANNPLFDNDPTIRKRASPSLPELIRQLAEGKIDAILQTEVEADYWLRNLGHAADVEKAPFKFTNKDPVYFALAKRSALAARTGELARILSELLADGTIAAIKARHLGR
jgi:polar amino acid transport system substrate-binding protein